MNGAPHMAEDPKNSSTPEAATPTSPKKPSIEDSHCSKNTDEATAARATDDDAEPQSTTNSPEESPLKVPFFPPRPPTPPPSSTPSQLAQLPNSIPPTTRDLSTLASKESFASLIRNRLPDPDPSAFRLHDPAETSEELPSANLSLPRSDRSGSVGKRSGTGSMGVLMSVVSSAKTRRRREAAGGSVASEEEPSEGERTDGEAGESVSVGSGSEGSGGARDTCGGGGGRREKKKEVKEGKKREEREEDGKQPEERRRRERRRNLWEEL